MKRSATRMATHVLALGAGAGMAMLVASRQPVTPSKAIPPQPPMANARSGTASVPASARMTDSEKSLRARAEEEAKAVTDYHAALDRILRESDAGTRGPDSWYFIAAILQRWLDADPDAAISWLGAFESRGGWGGFVKLAIEKTSGKDPAAFLDRMNGWSPRNRKRGLQELAECCLTQRPDSVATVLGKLTSDTERKAFMEELVSKVRPDASAPRVLEWVEASGGTAEEKLAFHRRIAGRIAGEGSLPPGSGGRAASDDWTARAQAFIRSIEDPEIRAPYEAALAERVWNTSFSDAMNLADTDLNGSYGRILQLLREKTPGTSEEQLSRQALQRLGARIHPTNDPGFLKEMAAVSTGERTIGEALDRYSASLGSNPAPIAEQLRKQALQEAFMWNPETASYVARHFGAEALAGLMPQTGGHGPSDQARWLSGLMRSGGWETLPEKQRMGWTTSVASKLFAEDENGGLEWARSLPGDGDRKAAFESVAKSLRGQKRDREADELLHETTR